MTTAQPAVSAEQLANDFLDEILADIGGEEVIEGVDDAAAAIAPTASEDEIVEPVAIAAEEIITEEEIEAAAMREAIYASQAEEQPVSAAEAPTTTPEEMLTESEPKAAKATKAKKDKAASEPKQPKKPAATSVNTKAGDLLMLKLGEKAKDYLVFNTTDSEEVAQAKAQELIGILNDGKIADKVSEKVLQLFSGLVKGQVSNEVMKRAFQVLHKDGELTSGDKGNLQTNLLSKPYSVGTARSQSNQIFMLFPLLEITIKEKGRMIPNPNSALLAVANAYLGL